MRKWIIDFKNKDFCFTESYYDLVDDWNLVEASLASQYNIRIRYNPEMTWDEFCTLVSGLMPETPLGNVVAIRAEKDPKIIAGFSKEQKRIHREWNLKIARAYLKNEENYVKSMELLESTFSRMFGKKGEGGENK